MVSLIISSIVVLIVPKLIGVEEYGYWQLYLFYTSYVGFLHFGWNDGIYLRYGGKEYGELDKRLFFSQFYMLVFFQLLIAIAIYITTIFLLRNPDRLFIIHMTAICMLIVNIRYMLLFILQSTGRIKEYAQITMLDRFLYIVLIITFLLIGIREYKLMIMADLVAKLSLLIYAMYCCKDMVFLKITSFYFSFKEALDNINVGIKLMFSNIASILLIGVVRFGIEHSWSVLTFGKISLAFSVSNLMMLFINAVGIIMFPILRRTEEKKLAFIYVTMRDFLMIILLGMLIIYYPFKVILSSWLPEYADSLKYMSLLFPMCVYEGKTALLINTYLKTLRKESLILKINMISLVLSLVTTFITTLMLVNLNLAILSILFLLAFRCILAEILLLRILEISMLKDIVVELIVTLTFIFMAWYQNSIFGILMYLFVYIVYLIIKHHDITDAIKNVKLLAKKNSI